MKTVGSRLAELDKLIQSVYEDKVAGRIEPDMAFDMLDKYQAEKKTLKAEYDEMATRCESERQDEEDVAEFISRLKRYAGATELTREMCLDLIEYFTVDAYQGRKAVRDIHIYYKLIDKPTRTPYEQPITAINRRFCYKSNGTLPAEEECRCFILVNNPLLESCSDRKIDVTPCKRCEDMI